MISPWRAITLVCCMAAIFGCMLTYSITFFTLIAEERYKSPLLVGIAMSLHAVPVVLYGSLMPRLLLRHGIWRIAVASYLIQAAGFAIVASSEAYGWHVFGRMLTGGGVSLTFVVMEIWLNTLSPEGSRGKVMGTYGAIVAGAFGLGSGIIILTGIDTGSAWTTIALFWLCSTAFLPFLRPFHAVQSIELDFHPLRVIRRLPGVAIAGLMFGLMETTLIALLPLYGMATGMVRGDAILLFPVFISGSIIVQTLYGFLVDHIDRRMALVTSLALSMMGFLGLLSISPENPWLWPLLFVCGGLFSTIYSSALTLMGQALRGHAIANGAITMVMMYGAGTLIGSAATGGAMTIIGASGLPIMMAACCGLALLVVCLRYHKDMEHPQESAEGEA